ncbi:Hypothetical predicted protein [Lecanosticta acicola]|uniref:DRBM domain-containing protein n=1 Tax=Lecanosticta acicola TaxID=111012 RepID=A0AAI8W0Q6_9PEZI|nr:Hypothetical predicted protein [Lecanosticta acicola]
MDAIMSSLLLYQDGQLVTASSASSRCSQESARRQRVVDTRDDSKAAEARFTRKVPRTASEMATDTSVLSPKEEADQERRGFSNSCNDRLTTSSPPCITAPIAGQPKLRDTTARRSANTTSTLQHSTPYLDARRTHIVSQDCKMGDMGAVNLMSMADWETAHPYTPPPTKPPRPTALPLRLENNNGTAIGKVHSLCQQKGLSLEIKTQQVAQGCFTAALWINGSEIKKGERQYASKQDAKEAICQSHVAYVIDLPNNKKRKSASLDDLCSSEPEGVDDEEWMGILCNYMQTTHKVKRPDVKTTSMSANIGPWMCELRIPEGPLTPFGDGSGPFRSKKIAERVAAKAAVEWLRTNGKLPEMGRFHNPNKKKQKPASDTTQSLTEDYTGLSQTLPKAMDVHATPDETAGRQVHRLAVELRFTQPALKFEPREGPFVDAWAEFLPQDTSYEPRLGGQVCRINHVFGKKAAKEEVWRAVLAVLEQIKKDRMAS